MINEYTKSFTEGEREAMRKMAAETRLAKLEWAKENLRDNYKDHPNWRELASKHNIRLPQSHLPATETKHIKRVFRKTGLDISKWLEEACGCKTIKELNDLNPGAPAYAVCGWALEWIESELIAV